MHQMFSVHTTPERFENATITGHFGMCLRKTAAGKSHHYRDNIVLEKLRFRKVGVSKFLRFEGHFRKAPFLWRISVEGRPNRRNKAAFSNFSSDVVDAAWEQRISRQYWRGFLITSSINNECRIYGKLLLDQLLSHPCGPWEDHWSRSSRTKKSWRISVPAKPSMTVLPRVRFPRFSERSPLSLVPVCVDPKHTFPGKQPYRHTTRCITVVINCQILHRSIEGNVWKLIRRF